MKVWCLFESSEHDDIYERDVDGVSLIGLFFTEQAARDAMEQESAKIETSDCDTIDKAWCRIEVSKWSTVVKADGKDGYEHDCDWKWWIEEREVK